MRSLVAFVAIFFASITQAATNNYESDSHVPPTQASRLHLHDDRFHPDIILHVTSKNLSVGCEWRESVVINGTSPGPELRIKPGRTTWIRVYNDLHTENMTMHWHGLSQRLSPFADGTPQASQYPIPAGYFYDYELHPLRTEAGGTNFYHSHVGFQASTAAGAIIIEDDGPSPYKYDEDRVLMFMDYYNKTDSEIETGLLASPFVWSGEPNALLLNGVGVATGRTAGEGDCELPVLNVDPGKTYRLRFIGATAISMVQFSIVGHQKFTIIAADSIYTRPYTVELMQLSSGQRFDVLFKTKTEEELGGQTEFYIQMETKERPTIVRSYGVLRYPGKTPAITTGLATPPLVFTNATYNWAEYALEPLKPNGFPTAAEVTRRIEIDSRQLTMDTIVWRMNNFGWMESSPRESRDKPYLIAIYEDGPSAVPDYDAALKNGGWDPQRYIWPARIGEVIEIIWYNTGSLVKNNGGVDYHPFHAHGGHFYDIGSGNGTYNATENEERLKYYNPVLRDVTNLYRFGTKTEAGERAGWRAWRIRVESAGVWMIHCHILQHMIMGMQTVWAFGDYSQIASLPNDDVQGYFTFGGNVYGNKTQSPMMPHFFEDTH